MSVLGVLGVKRVATIKCNACQRSRPHHGRGLCSGCYRNATIRGAFKPEPRPEIDDRVPRTPDDSLACVAYPRCKAVEKVAPGFREDRVRIGCPWVICDACKNLMDEVGDD